MGQPVIGELRFDSLVRRGCEGTAELFFNCGEKLIEAPVIQHIFEPGLVPVGAVPFIDEDPYNRIRNPSSVGWLHDDARVAREVSMSCDAAERQPEPHARLNPKAVANPNSLETNVIRILERWNAPGSVERDIEFPW